MISSDAPIYEKEQDRFQRYDFSKRIAKIASHYRGDNSLVIGVYGKWGEGKTTVLNFVQKELPKDTVVVNFNPWLFSDQEHLLRSFFKSIASAAVKKTEVRRSRFSFLFRGVLRLLGVGSDIDGNKESIGNLLVEYAEVIGLSTQFIPAVGFNSSKVITTVGKKLKGKDGIEDIRLKINKRIKDLDCNIVVFIDDIDRLDIEETQYIFKLVKLVGDFPNTTYILAFDDEMVSSALAPKFVGSNGYNYLEKIINVPLHIPKESKSALSEYLEEKIKDVLKKNEVSVGKDDELRYFEALNTVLIPEITTARNIQRISNELAVYLPLLKNEVNISDYVILTGINVLFPELYALVRSNQDYFLLSTRPTSNVYEIKRRKDEKENAKAAIDELLSNYSRVTQKMLLQLLIRLFPQLKSIYDNHGHIDSVAAKWHKHKRICSPQYFSRYFAYTISEGDIPEKDIQKLLSEIENSNSASIAQRLLEIAKIYSSFSLFFKLNVFIDSLSPRSLNNIVIAIAKVGRSIIAGKYAGSASAIMGLFVESCISNLPKEDRLHTALLMFENAETLELAMEMNYNIMFHQREKPDGNAFSSQDKIAIQRKLVNIFKNQMSQDSFFSLLPDHELYRLLMWWADLKDERYELEEFIVNSLSSENGLEFALDLLKIFVSTINSTSFNPKDSDYTTRTFKAGFYEDNYKDLLKVVNVDLLNQNLVPQFGMNPSKVEPSSISDKEPLDDAKIVSIFQWFFQNQEESKVNDLE